MLNVLRRPRRRRPCEPQVAGVRRLVYNFDLEQRGDHARGYRVAPCRALNYIAQARELTALRAGFAVLRAVNVSAEQRALKELYATFQAFFEGRAKLPR